MRLTASLMLAIACLLTQPALAAPRPACLGRWLIAEARPAPWFDAAEPGTAPVPSDLVGKSVVFAPGRITGPRLLACRGPLYRMRDYPPGNLFQGNLGSPAAQAAALGFRGEKIATLETGCAASLDFHFVDRGTALFALDNMIYTLRKRPG